MAKGDSQPNAFQSAMQGIGQAGQQASPLLNSMVATGRGAPMDAASMAGTAGGIGGSTGPSPETLQALIQAIMKAQQNQQDQGPIPSMQSTPVLPPRNPNPSLSFR